MNGSKKEPVKAWRGPMPKPKKGCREVSVKCGLVAEQTNCHHFCRSS
jgi:hypothetical protein